MPIFKVEVKLTISENTREPTGDTVSDAVSGVCELTNGQSEETHVFCEH